MRLGFIGLGKMGRRMAERLAGTYGVLGWNRSPARTFLEKARTPRECAERADALVLMLADGAALDAVLCGNDGLLAGIRPGTLVIEMSTSGRAAALRAAAQVYARGGRYVDAPVSGSVGPAERGELVALVGATDEDLTAAEPILRVMCKRIVRAGGVGQGQALKVVLNGLGAHHLVAFGSMLALGERAGLARETIVEAFTSGAFASPSYLGKKAKVLARDYAPEFTLVHTDKDVTLTEELGREVGAELPVVHALHEEVRRAIDAGLGDKDLFAIEEYFAKR